MYQLISWKRKFFSRTYQFFLNSSEIGYFRFSGWTHKASCKINETELEFSTRGFFNLETTIVDTRNSSIVGAITYARWRSKANLKLANGEEYQWQYDSFWQSKWSITNGKIFVNYNGSSLSGEIRSTTDSETIILAGFYIARFLKARSQATAAAAS